MTKRTLARVPHLALRIAGSALLLALLAWYADPAALWAQLRGIDPAYFAAAVVVGLGSNLVSALRWRSIAQRLGVAAPPAAMILLYARGMTANALLPGGPVGGDALRSWQLARTGNDIRACALSVVLDRASGLWLLCALSLGGTLWLALAPLHPGTERSFPPGTAAYALALLAAVSVPFLPAMVSHPWLEGARTARGALLSSAGYSLGVQLAAIAALWLCTRAVGMEIPFALALAGAALIFVAAALPAGVAGFGGRELGALVAFGSAGVPREQAIAAALVYGAAALVQGVMAAPSALGRWR